MKLANPFYTESVGARWAICAVAHPTLERAESATRESSKEPCTVRVYDCTGGPIGALVCNYFNGERKAP